MAALHKSNKGKRARPKGAYGVRRTQDSDGKRNEYAYVSGLHRIPVALPNTPARDNYKAQLAASTDACAFLDELVELSPDLRNSARAEGAKPFVSISLNPIVPLDPQQRARAWQRWEEAQGLSGAPYIEWTHGKSLDVRPEHYHRLYPRVRVDGDARIIGMTDDWLKNELASVLTSFDNRGRDAVRCYPGRHAAWVHDKLTVEYPEVRQYFVDAVRERIAETNTKREARGQKPFAVPDDDRQACALFSAKCLDRRTSPFFRPNTDPSRPSEPVVAREVVPLLLGATDLEGSQAALAGTRWRLAQGRHAPVVVCVRSPGGDATGTAYSLASLVRAHHIEAHGVEPETGDVGRWVSQRVPAGSTLPTRATVARLADPERDRLRRQRKAITEASRSIKALTTAIRDAGRGPEAVAARLALDAELQRAKEIRRTKRRALNDARALRVETSVIVDPNAAVSPWIARPDGLHLDGLGKRKRDRQIQWDKLARTLRRSLKGRTGGQGTITVHGGNGGVARADRLILALHADGRPGFAVTNIEQSPELQSAVRRVVARAANRRTVAATEAARQEHLATLNAANSSRTMLWSQAYPPSRLMEDPEIAEQAKQIREFARRHDIHLDPPRKGSLRQARQPGQQPTPETPIQQRPMKAMPAKDRQPPQPSTPAAVASPSRPSPMVVQHILNRGR